MPGHCIADMYVLLNTSTCRSILTRDGEWQGEVAEAIKCDGDFRTLWADPCGLMEAVDDVQDDAVVSLLVVRPGLGGDFLKTLILFEFVCISHEIREGNKIINF